MGQEGRHLPELGHLGATPRALHEVELDQLALVGLDRIEREGAGERPQLLVAQLSVHAPLTPASES